MHLAGRIVVIFCVFLSESLAVQCVDISRLRFGLAPGAWFRGVAFFDVGRNFLDWLLNVNQFGVEEDVTFWCVHSSGQATLQQVFIDDGDWDQKLNVTLPLAIFVHGWLDHRNVGWMKYFVDDYTRLVPTNLCIVDWKRLAQNTPYLSSMSIDSVAQHTTKFLLSLISNGFRLKDTTLVGFSFGAHIVGVAGQLLDGRVARVIGLDPAGVYVTAFTKRSPKHRLDRTSGQFVQAIHTESNVLGTKINMAHQDFYPSGGEWPQPGCIVPILQTGLDFREFIEMIDR
jgi:Lipase